MDVHVYCHAHTLSLPNSFVGVYEFVILTFGNCDVHHSIKGGWCFREKMHAADRPPVPSTLKKSTCFIRIVLFVSVAKLFGAVCLLELIMCT